MAELTGRGVCTWNDCDPPGVGVGDDLFQLRRRVNLRLPAAKADVIRAQLGEGGGGERPGVIVSHVQMEVADLVEAGGLGGVQQLVWGNEGAGRVNHDPPVRCVREIGEVIGGEGCSLERYAGDAHGLQQRRRTPGAASVGVAANPHAAAINDQAVGAPPQ